MSVVNESHLDRLHNLVSVLLAIGSPTLAGYSLVITRFNSRWLAHQFLNRQFPNRINLPLAVSALQHIPFGIDNSGPLLPSLIILPKNDRYWKSLSDAAKRTRQWTIPMVMNIIWVLVAFAFVIVGSLVDFNDVISVPGDAGYPIAAVWTYLLPLVVGWLHVGSQLEAGQLDRALKDANHTAYVATAGAPAPATGIPPVIEQSVEFIDHVNADEKKTAPIFNYARVFIWSQHAEYILGLWQRAAENARWKITVRRGGVWTSNEDSINDEDRIGNEEEVVEYCMEKLRDVANLSPPLGPQHFPVPYTPRSFYLTTAAPGDKEAAEADTPTNSIFATEVFLRVAFAAILAHVLQWGTTGASILIHIFTPPKGIGCRALTFILYGAAGTLAFWLLLLSSILGHWTRRTNERSRSGVKLFTGYIAALTRWLGKFVAITNGLGILVACCMQFAGMYDNCFCSSTIFGGDPNGLVKFLDPNVKGSEVYGYWIGGITLAFGMSGLYASAIYLATPMSRE